MSHLDWKSCPHDRSAHRDDTSAWASQRFLLSVANQVEVLLYAVIGKSVAGRVRMSTSINRSIEPFL